MYRSRTPLQDPALQVPCIKLENIVDKTISLGLSNDMNIFVLIQIYVYHVLMLSHKILINYALALLGMGPSTCSLDARSVLGLFYGARARVLESEHMLVLARARG